MSEPVMEPATATCGCGRPMRVDALTGPLAFRCGCGASFQLVAPQLDGQVLRCLFNEGISRCRGRRVARYPLCEMHVAKIVAQGTGLEAKYRRESRASAAASSARFREELKQRLTPDLGWAERERREQHSKKLPGSVVYYVLTRPGQVKIGTTINLSDRMKSMRVFNQEDLLAAEPGDAQLEKMRHAQFGDLRLSSRREDFSASGALMDHIKMVREHFGDPHTLPARLLAQGGGETVISA
jgi:hypothetical protein